MLVTNALEREFIIEEGSRNIPLTDPHSAWSVERVLDFYAPNYPILTTATIKGPEILNDKLRFVFQSTIGTKG